MCILGLVMSNSRNDYSKMQFTGILQTIACAYFVLSLMEILLPKKALTSDGEVSRANLYKKIAFMSLLPITNLVATFVYQNTEHNCPRGYQGPGGLSDG